MFDNKRVFYEEYRLMTEIGDEGRLMGMNVGIYVPGDHFRKEVTLANEWMMYAHW